MRYSAAGHPMCRSRVPVNMTRMIHTRFWCWLWLSALCATAAARADALRAVDVLRMGGCGGELPAARPLQHNILLDRSAELWSGGQMPRAAADRSGYWA